MVSKRKSPFGVRRRLNWPSAWPGHHLHVVAGPRQVGKTTLVQQVRDALAVPVRYASADEPTLRGADWIDEPSCSQMSPT